MSDIQTQIKEAAKWRGVTAPMLMDAMHLTNWSYALRLITGRQDMRISTLEKLAAALGYEVQLVRKVPLDCNARIYPPDAVQPGRSNGGA